MKIQISPYDKRLEEFRELCHKRLGLEIGELYAIHVIDFLNICCDSDVEFIAVIQLVCTRLMKND